MSDPVTVVRPMRDQDVAGAAAALVEVHGTDGYPVYGVARPEATVRPPGVVRAWVAEADGVIVGHVAVRRPQGDEGAVALWREQSGEDDSRIGVVSRLFVVRGARGQAVGERLMREAMSFGRARSLRLVLDVVERDSAAVRLYERLGWRAIGGAQHPYGDGRRVAVRCYVGPDLLRAVEGG
ncbi:GNAT family N-acetyltransferase [Actinacidiphila sp. ITFR-21]|uniref:GNAT family N-acetyltransferase n=1 Tax=Actinacidiphila sp. ITFR-21 TaxID=3075199 RepID=UPI00288C5726|nr:GNAT family N-acetyltransferase [Streptomyces sp. ITFR-21]WNI16254.1 GNAT family N-acetyltransferase [Streptomyces sp. ITFR-21]